MEENSGNGEHNKRGRPTDYRPEYCARLIEHMAQGYSFESFAGLIGCSKVTLYAWAEANPEFMNAKSEATERCRLFWEGVGVRGHMSHKDTKLNTGVWIFNMKNRFPAEWRERNEVKVGALEDAPLAVTIKVVADAKPKPE